MEYPRQLDCGAFLSQIDHLDDHKVQLKADGVTRPGQVVVIKGEGMPVFESVRGYGATPFNPGSEGSPPAPQHIACGDCRSGAFPNYAVLMQRQGASFLCAAEAQGGPVRDVHSGVPAAAQRGAEAGCAGTLPAGLHAAAARGALVIRSLEERIA